MPAPINVALVGYGFVGKTVHAPLIASVEGLRLHTIVSRQGAQVESAHPGVRVRADVQEAFADSEIELIVIAAPNQVHADLAHAALASGKHVVVDKPFTTTLAEAHAVVAHAERVSRLVSVFQNRRWDTEFLTLRRLQAERAFGEIVECHSHYDRFRPQVQDRWRERPGPGAGIWFDLGPHLVDQALQLFGLPDSLYADIGAQRPGSAVDDYFHVLLRYPTRRVILHGGSLVLANSLRFAVHGTRASFIKHGLDPQEAALKRGGTPREPDWGVDPQPGQLMTITSDGPSFALAPSEPGDYRRFYTAMRDAIRLGTPPPVTPREALDVMRILELAVTSAATGQERRVTADADAAPSKGSASAAGASRP